MNALFAGVVAATIVAANAVAGDVVGRSTADILRTCAPAGSYRTMNVGKYRPACVISLRHPIEGIVECALRDAMMLKLAKPELDVADITHEIHRLTTEGATPTIRYKAWLASAVYENPAMFADVIKTDFFTAEEAFAAVARRLELTLLAARQ